MVIPASEAWDSASPIMEYRRKTRKMPIHGHRTDMKADTIKAFCIKAYLSMGIAPSPPQEFVGVLLRGADMPMAAGEMVNERRVLDAASRLCSTDTMVIPSPG
jgi:hypothetical protein